MVLNFKPKNTHLAIASAIAIICLARLSTTHAQDYNNHQQRQASSSAMIARRAADQSRPLTRVNRNLRRADNKPDEVEPPIVQGKFKAPPPQQFQLRKIARNSDFSSQTLGASMQVSDASTPSKVVNGILGATGPQMNFADKNMKRNGGKVERNVGATIQVSDEGLNYPPSKLSADIYGNVAEIITAPPSQVDVDFLIPQLNRLYAKPTN